MQLLLLYLDHTTFYGLNFFYNLTTTTSDRRKNARGGEIIYLLVLLPLWVLNYLLLDHGLPFGVELPISVFRSTYE